MRQTRKLKRKRRRRIKKGIKIGALVVMIIIALLILCRIGFKMNAVKTTLDLGQFTNSEVKSYLDDKGIDNTLLFWLKNKIGQSDKLELFEDYTVQMISPFEVKITAYEKKLKCYIEKDGIYYYLDENGKILKTGEEKLKGIPQIAGVKYSNLKLYKKVQVSDSKSFEYVLSVADSIQDYGFNIKKIKINKNAEVTFYIRKVRVQLGKNTNLDKKLKDFNDMHKKVIKYQGVLNMKHVSEDGSYTLKKTQRKKKQNK
jgi:hypothetical protein